MAVSVSCRFAVSFSMVGSGCFCPDFVLGVRVERTVLGCAYYNYSGFGLIERHLLASLLCGSFLVVSQVSS